MRLPPPARRAPSVLAVALLVLAGLACLPREAHAQRYGSAATRSTSRSKGGRQTASGNDFPSWEHDVGIQQGVPLPEGRPGHYSAIAAIDAGGTPLGVAAISGGVFAASLAEGGVKFVDAQGKDVAHVETAPCTLPPVALDGSVLVACGKSLLRVAPEGILWTHDVPADVGISPVAVGSGVAVATSLGHLELLDAATGSARWSIVTSGAVVAMRLLRTVVVVAQADGSVVGLDLASGQELWRTSIGDRADSLIADEHAAWAAGHGRSNRTKVEADLIARLPLADGGRRLTGGRDWRLRVGGTCVAAPLLLDDVVAFACHDGYVHAIDRKKGVGGWRTDLPARTWHEPLLAGGRLDFVLDQTRFVVALAADNGAVLGWSELEDTDETFVGPAAWAANVTVAATSLGRLVMLGWEWEEKQVPVAEPGQHPVYTPP